MPVKLGELLLKENMVTPQQLQEALTHQRTNGGKLGKAFVSLGYVRDEEITSLLSRQYGVPSINLDHFEVDPSIIKIIPAETTRGDDLDLSLIHISEPTRLLSISYAVF